MASATLLVLGHVTEDWVELPGQPRARRLGGAASFCAQVGVRRGERTAVVTSAPDDFDLLVELQGSGADVRVVPAARPTVFRLDYRGPVRELYLHARATPLEVHHVPRAWLQTPVAFVGPVADEVSPSLVRACEGFVGIGLQGLLRQTDDSLRVRPRWPGEWLASWPCNVRVALLSDEDDADAGALAAAVAAKGAIVALTHGAQGATIFTQANQQQPLSTLHIPAAPAACVDPTGAGDTFAVVFTLALARGHSLGSAGAAAAAAAARVIEGPGLGRL